MAVATSNMEFYNSIIDSMMKTSMEKHTLSITDRIQPILKDRKVKDQRPKKDISQFVMSGNKKHCIMNRYPVSLFEFYSQKDHERFCSQSNGGHGSTLRAKGKGGNHIVKQKEVRAKVTVCVPKERGVVNKKSRDSKVKEQILSHPKVVPTKHQFQHFP